MHILLAKMMLILRS